MDLELDVHPNCRRYCFKTILEPNLFAKNSWDELRLIIEHLSQQMVYDFFSPMENEVLSISGAELIRLGPRVWRNQLLRGRHLWVGFFFFELGGSPNRMVYNEKSW